MIVLLSSRWPNQRSKSRRKKTLDGGRRQQKMGRDDSESTLDNSNNELYYDAQGNAVDLEEILRLKNTRTPKSPTKGASNAKLKGIFAY